MGKVRDETPAAKTAKPTPRGGNRAGSRFTPFLTNLVRSDSYKAQQGWYARLWTAIGLGLLVLAGIYRLYDTQLRGETSLTVQYSVPVALLVVLGWLIYRLVQFPPFVDFLIATEAEMNKVSWTSKAELKRATIVVLSTVALLAMYLLLVDWVWIFLLRTIRVLNTGETSDFGSQAG